ncbi:hypothetical protein SAY87_027186 [Trapa incisa]|uniref:Glucosamine/galactosamine-6-phosphate isomerase domain-containing protein n=1 Tax=Trapa incisa TaxID=236973 RepID=A0AAN7JLU6_9MYRT|nr:hypothetical protein SAY87_027186 [Trapa incisa]
MEPPHVDSVDWSKWRVFWVDELSPKDHEDGNYKLAYNGFLSKVPILPGNDSSINDALSAEDYETRIKQLVKNNVVSLSTSTGWFPKLDPMETDGHVASFFPRHPLINVERWVTLHQGLTKAVSTEDHLHIPVDQLICIHSNGGGGAW